jgi:hypothetical protein
MAMLINLMAVLAHQNPMAASLAMDLAQELRKSGVDHSAAQQVCHPFLNVVPLRYLLTVGSRIDSVDRYDDGSRRPSGSEQSQDWHHQHMSRTFHTYALAIEASCADAAG